MNNILYHIAQSGGGGGLEQRVKNCQTGRNKNPIRGRGGWKSSLSCLAQSDFLRLEVKKFRSGYPKTIGRIAIHDS